MVGVSSGGRTGPFGTLFACGSIGGKTDGELLELFTSGEVAEAAFEALVVNHGPTVLRACRRVLSDPNDADDAFQATFLVLARRASSVGIGRPDSLGPWLHGVALRVARRARVAAARRRRHEARVAGRPDAAVSRADGLAVAVREEVERLPEPLRSPVVLCYLEEMTYQGAARQLRVSEGTIRGRLVKARRLLRSRLGRHEDVFPTGRTEGSSCDANPPRVAPALVAATTRAALAFAPGGAGMAALPAGLAALMEGVLMMMLVTRWMIGAVSLAAVCLVAGGGAALTAKGDDKPAAAKAVTSEKEPRKVEGRPNQPPASLPAQVLTLDDAIARLLMRSLDLRSKFAEIPMARADVPIAGLRDRSGSSADGPPFRMGQNAALNSFDTSFAPPQFDTNLADPTDVTIKRRARPVAAKNVIEAQYQDAVRHRIDALYSAYVDVQEVQELIHLQNRARTGLGPLLHATTVEEPKGAQSQLDHDVLMSAYLTLAGPEDGQGDRARARRRALARLLDLTASEADGLKVEPISPMRPIPPVGYLIRTGLQTRPDIAALRLGLVTAEAAVVAASEPSPRGENFHRLYQPYTFGDKLEADREGAKSNALGVTVPLPVHGRDQGNVSRAKINLQQTQLQLASAEKALAQEIERLHRRCESGLAELQGLRTMIQRERRACQGVERAYAAGEAGSVDIRNAWFALQDAERRHLKLMAEHRRNLLALNTAVGRRLFP